MNKDELVDYCKEASQTISELDYKNRLLEKENQELKSQLKETTHCFDEEEHKRLSEQLELLTSKLDEYDLIVDERNQLKKQLEEYKDKINWYENFEINKTIDKLRLKHNTQQKEFTKWLEDEIHTIETTFSQINGNYGLMNEKLEALKEVLQKYEEIIGVEDENNIK